MQKGQQREERRTMTAPASLRVRKLCFITNRAIEPVPVLVLFGVVSGNWQSLSIQHNDSPCPGEDFSTTATSQTAAA